MVSADERLFLWINGLAGEFQPLDTFITWVVSDYLIPVGMALALIAFWFAGQDAGPASAGRWACSPPSPRWRCPTGPSTSSTGTTSARARSSSSPTR